jgi:2-polyprenyl-3-methyl-5-hydroxy-6-metoxy-1,4-benzoquinol methylase
MARCIICGGKPVRTSFGYRKPDKYEQWEGVKNIKRLWVMCGNCGFYWQLRNYPLSELETIYKDGYRKRSFRGESISDAYDRLRAIPNNENEERYYWFTSNLRFEKARRVLDVGSGIGVWPAILSDADYHVTCVEESKDSVGFISRELGLNCWYHLEDVAGLYDTVSLINVLEHIENIDSFLQVIRKRLRAGGYLLVEVPDSSEFGYLEKDHDEFNSCHVWFFDMGSLYQVLKRNGFVPIHATKKFYKKRKLSRVLMVCN